MDRRQFLHATGVITTAVGSSGALLTAALAQASERHSVGAPVMRRFDQERWVLDNVIQANGIDWDQPHTAILLRACGLDVVGDMNGLKQRVKKFADIAPAFEALARRREERAKEAEKAQVRIPARDNYFIAAQYWASAMWPIDEVNDTLKMYNTKKREMFTKYMEFADHHVEWAEIPYRGKTLPAVFHLPPGYQSGSKVPVVVIVPGMDGYKEKYSAMQNVVNRRWLLKSYPEGMPSLENWTMDVQPVPDPGPGKILVKAKWLSVDPYMRGRMSPATNYTKGVGLGEVMQGGGVGEVVASNHPAWKIGDIAESMSFGWQEWSVLTPDIFGPAGVNKIDSEVAPIESSLSWLGMPGITAYFGLLEVGHPKPGETVVVSAASGAVGQLVGQIAKLAGCRAVAIAGDDNKLQWCREIGFDAAINYKKVNDLTAAVKEACPQGVDVFFDNTAGPIHDAAMKNLNMGARVVICGRVALAGQFGKPDIGERFMGHLIVTRASMHGFLAFDWWHRRDEALKRLANWQRSGKIRFKEDVLSGIERMPEAFLRLLEGQNFGKQIVKIA